MGMAEDKHMPGCEMPIHPICDLFPMMDAKSLAGLAADIKLNGLLSAIVLHEGQIVDGRNRLVACREAGVEPHFVRWRELYTGEMPVDRWIWSLNVERRHLTPDQIAWAIVQRRAWEEGRAARDRQVEAGKRGGETAGRGRPKADSLPVEAPEPYREPTADRHPDAKPKSRDRSGEVRTKLAKEAGTSINKIRQALAVQGLAKQQKVRPEVAEQLKQGTVKLHEVLNQVDVAAVPPPLVSRRECVSSDARTKRQKEIDAAAKRRTIDALSQIQGLCRGLLELNTAAVRQACTAEETATWAAIARNAARTLRLFSTKLASTKENNE